MKLKIFKFLVTGGTATLIHMSVLYVLTEYGGVWYLKSVTAAFLTAFAYNFYLQKNWVFSQQQENRASRQMALFLLANLINLSVNAMGMVILVEYFGLWYMASQFFLIGMLSVASFIIYRKFIFI